MKTLITTVLAITCATTLLLSGYHSADAAKPCARTSFKTKLVKEACEAGGQKAAKKAMRKFMKKAKKATKEKFTCKTCHSKTSGTFPLKPDGLKRYNVAKKAM